MFERKGMIQLHEVIQSKIVSGKSQNSNTKSSLSPEQLFSIEYIPPLRCVQKRYYDFVKRLGYHELMQAEKLPTQQSLYF